MKIIDKFDLLFSSFNQDCSCLAIGTKAGFKIFNCEPFGKTLVRNDGGIGIVEMLFNTSLIALVGAGEQPTHSPRRLQIMNTKKQLIIGELTFPTAIVSVHLNRKTLAVVLSSSIQLYDLSNMRLIYTIETNYFPNMITALSPSSDSNYLAYPTYIPPLTDTSSSSSSSSSSSLSSVPITAPLPPSYGVPSSQSSFSSPTISPLTSPPPPPPLSSTSSSATSTSIPTPTPTPTSTPSSTSSLSGQVTLFDIQALQPVLVLSAHKSSLTAMTFSYSGRYLATASMKGTLIRVFSIPGGSQLYEFRRGSYPVHGIAMEFHPNETLLAVASETETIHLFKLNGSSSTSSSSSSSSSSSLSSSIPTSSSFTFIQGVTSVVFHRKLQAYLPKSVATRMMDPTRDIAYAKLPSSSIGYPPSVGFSTSTPHLFVVTKEGYFYKYFMDLEKGEECPLVQQEWLLEKPPSH